jgi:hypothetical protein
LLDRRRLERSLNPCSDAGGYQKESKRSIEMTAATPGLTGRRVF